MTREGSRTLVADIALASRKETEDCNAAEFFRAVMKEEPRTASRYARVARFASPRDEQAGSSKPSWASPSRTKSLEGATVAEIAAATGKLTSAARKKPKTPARAALEKALGAISSLAGVRVSESGGPT